jgi:hypothetical protein
MSAHRDTAWLEGRYKRIVRKYRSNVERKRAIDKWSRGADCNDANN